MYNVKDTTAAWSLHWFQIVSNLAHCQQDQQDRTRASWNSQHSSKLPNDWNSPNPRDPHSLPSAAHHIWFHLWNLPGPHRPDTKLVGWGSVGRLGWSQFEFIPCHPWSIGIYRLKTCHPCVAVPALHKSHLVKAVPGCRDPRQARVPQSTTTTMPAMKFAWKLTRQKAGRNRTAS